MRRALPLGLLLLALAAVAVYQLLLRDSTAAPDLKGRPVAVIGSGDTAVAVSASGTVLYWMPAPEEGSLPSLPLLTRPTRHRLAGPALQQVRVLAAAPRPLLDHVGATFYGERGVDVVLRSGIELRFGDASQATRKWRAAAAVLASPSTTAADYVDLRAPGHPAVGGSSHPLPPVP